MENSSIDNILNRAKQLKPELDRQEAERLAYIQRKAERRDAERKSHDERIRVSNERASDFVRLMEEYEIPKIEFYSRKVPKFGSKEQVEATSLGEGWIIKPAKTDHRWVENIDFPDFKQGIFLIAENKCAYVLTNIDHYGSSYSSWGLKGNETVISELLHLQSLDAPFANDAGLDLLATAAILHGVV